MDKNKRAQEEDHEQLVQLLKELKDDKKEVRQIVTETNGQVAEVLRLLQTVRFHPFVGSFRWLPSKPILLATRCFFSI